MKVFAIILAGGKGNRMEHMVPKQFHLLMGKPVLYYSIATFLQAYPDVQFIIVLPEEYHQKGKEILHFHFPDQQFRIATGGKTRFDSASQGLSLVDESGIVIVHDAARCLVTSELVKRCGESALQHGSAVPVINCRDSVRIITGNNSESVERQRIKLVQTPQAFTSEVILPAFKTAYKEMFTDEASVVEAFGIKLHLIEGAEENIKITRPADMALAESILNARTI